jgi:hypothetical protein
MPGTLDWSFCNRHKNISVVVGFDTTYSCTYQHYGGTFLQVNEVQWWKYSFRRAYVIKTHPVPNHWIVVNLHGVRTQNATIWTIPSMNIWKIIFVLCYLLPYCIVLATQAKSLCFPRGCSKKYGPVRSSSCNYGFSCSAADVTDESHCRILVRN